ncbi:hypothetical protein L228DRAFT_244932 [Xylona heveae TC161]|uniref:Uncharacterized protein n=1 Tax=Xylona heveae (strain CBS 132557 / TC161) TaxID=1328760 RepID=A0A165HXB7_XYLHT|nr:hypothetical protein L228DRAFT_244932 [Xylona heveae TC161]KZF24060.1 hypothetical protein L228DRAFT_244932 [Xylona heveae TC161]
MTTVQPADPCQVWSRVYFRHLRQRVYSYIHREFPQNESPLQQLRDGLPSKFLPRRRMGNLGLSRKGRAVYLLTSLPPYSHEFIISSERS